MSYTTAHRLFAATLSILAMLVGIVHSESYGNYFYRSELNTVVKEYVNEKGGSKQNFFMDVKSPHVVEFYSPLCVSLVWSVKELWGSCVFVRCLLIILPACAFFSQPACLEFKPHYMALAKATFQKYPTIQFFAVSCDKHEDLCEEYGVSDFPTLRLFGGKSGAGNNNNNKFGIDMDPDNASPKRIASSLKVTSGGVNPLPKQLLRKPSSFIPDVDHRRTDELAEQEDEEDDHEGQTGAAGEDSDDEDEKDEKQDDNAAEDDDEKDGEDEYQPEVLSDTKFTDVLADQSDGTDADSPDEKGTEEDENDEIANADTADTDDEKDANDEEEDDDDEEGSGAAPDDNEIDEPASEADNEDDDAEENMLPDDEVEDSLPDLTSFEAPHLNLATQRRRDAGHAVARNKEKKLNRFSPQMLTEKTKYMNRRKGLGGFIRKDGTRDSRGRPLPRSTPEEMTVAMKQNTPGTAEYMQRKQAMYDRLKKNKKFRKNPVTNLKKEELPFKKDVRKSGFIKNAAEHIPVVKRIVKMSPEEELILDASLSFTIALETGVSMGLEDLKARATLRKWLDLLSIALPPEWAIHRLIDDLRRQFMFITQKRENMKSVVMKHPLPRSGWSNSCRSSGMKTGFSCGFWKLMHTVTVGIAEQRGGQNLVESGMVLPTAKIFSPLEAADTIRDYIDKFFTCRSCRQHFVENYDDCDKNRRCDRLTDNVEGASTADWKELPLWLWEVHNEVSIRLVREKVGSSYGKMGVRKMVTASDEIKAVWPNVDNCILCFYDDGTWNEGEVFRFLERSYWPGAEVDPKHYRLLTFDDESTSSFGFLWIITILIVWIIYSAIGKNSASIQKSVLTAKHMVSKAGDGISMGLASGKAKVAKKDG